VRFFCDGWVWFIVRVSERESPQTGDAGGIIILVPAGGYGVREAFRARVCHQERDNGKNALYPGFVDVVVATFAGNRCLRGASWEAADELNFGDGEAVFGSKGVLKFQAVIVQTGEAVMFKTAGTAVTGYGGGASA
jgi:hypothetical protein